MTWLYSNSQFEDHSRLVECYTGIAVLNNNAGT